jgi:hypothetical protein
VAVGERLSRSSRRSQPWQTPSNGNVYDAHAHAEDDARGEQTIFVTYSRAMPALFSSEVRLAAVTLQRRTFQAR